MNEEKETKIIVPESDLTKVPHIDDPEGFEDIGAPLTASTDLTLSKPTGAGTTALGISGYNGNLYALWSRTGATTGYVIRKYSATGTYDPTGDISIAPPTTGPRTWPRRATRFVEFQALEIYNNKIYIVDAWIHPANGHTVQAFTIAIYSITGAFESHVGSTGAIASFDVVDISILNNRIYYSATNPGAAIGYIPGWVYYWNIGESTSLNIALQNSRNEPTTFSAVTVSDRRLYISQGTTILAYDSSHNAVSSDNTTATSLLHSTRIGSTLYGQKLDGNIARYTGVPVYIASWATGTPSVATDRSVRIQLTISEDPTTTFSASDDFEVQNSSGATQSGWTISEIGTGTTSRLIEAKPSSTVAAGTYKLVLEENAFGTDRPDADVESPDFTIGTYTPVVSVSSLAPPTSSEQSPIITTTSTFVLTLDTAIPRTGELSASDFGTSSSGATIASVTGRGTGTTATTFDIVVNNPATGSGSYSISLNAESITAMGSIYAASPPYSFVSGLVYYAQPPNITVSDFNAPMGTQTGANSTFELILSHAIPRTGALDITDFTAAASTSIVSVTGRGTASTTTTFDIAVRNPTTAEGSYTITLNANAIAAGTGYLAGPTTAQESDSVTYDTRTVVSVSSFTRPATSPQTGATSTLVLTLNTAIPRTGTDSLDVNDFAAQMISGLSIASVTGQGAGTTTTMFNVVVNNPNNTRGTYTIDLNANAIDTNTLTGPSAAYTSQTVTYDRRPDLEVDHFRAPAGTQIGATSTFTLRFDRAIPRTGQLAITDFAPQANSGATIVSVTGQGTSSTTRDFNIVVRNPATATGSYTISLNANAVSGTDSYKQGPTTAFTSTQVTYNTRANLGVSSFRPSTTVGRTTGNRVTTDNVTLTLTLNRAIPRTGALDTTDFTAAASTSIVSVTGTGTAATTSSFNIVVRNPTTSRSDYTIQLNANAIAAGTTYNAGPSTAVNSDSIYYDTRRALTPSWETVTETQRTVNSTFELTFTTAIPRTGQLSITDFTITNVTGSGVTIASVTGQGTGTNATVFDVAITHPTTSSGSYTIGLNANAISASDNYLSSPAAAVTSGTITYNTIGFGATWQATPTYDASTNKISANIQFSHNVAGILAADDFEVVLGASDTNQSTWSFDTLNTSANANTNFLVAATAPANTNGSFRLKLKEDSLMYDGESSDNGPTDNVFSSSVAVDNRPQLTISSFNAPSGTQRGSTSTFVLTLSHGIPRTGSGSLSGTNFTTSVIDATIGSVTGRGQAATATIFDIVVNNPGNDQGTYTISMNPNSVTGSTTYKLGPLATDIRLRSTQVSFDTRGFSVIWSTPTYSSATSKMSANIQFNNDVTGIELTDFEVRDASNNPVSWTFDALSSSSASEDTNVLIAATVPANTNGSFTFRIAANSINYPDGTNNGPAAATSSPALVIDNRPQLAVSTFAPTAGLTEATAITGLTSIFRLTFDRPVETDQVDTNDFSVTTSGPSIDSVAAMRQSGEPSDRASVYDITVVNPSTGSGSYTIQIRASAVDGADNYKSGPISVHTSQSVFYDATPVVADATWTNVSYCETSSKLQGTLTFTSADIEGLGRSDFEVINAAGDDQRWLFDSPNANAMAGTGVLIQATVPPNTNGSFRLKLKMNSVRSGGSLSNNSPSADVISSPGVAIDLRPVIRVSSFTAPRETQTGATAALTLTFDRRIPAGELSTSDFMATNGASVTGINPTTGSSSAFTVTVTQPTNMSGTYTATLNANTVSAGTGYRAGPVAAFESRTVTFDTLPSNTSATVTVPIPMQSNGAIQISVNPRSFNVRGKTMQIGPEFRQYLGTVFYDTRTEFPPVARFELPSGIQTGTTSDINMTFVERDNINNQIEVQDLRPIDITLSGATTTYQLLSRKWSLFLAEGRTTLTAANVTVMGNQVNLVERDPREPSTGAIRRWSITLQNPEIIDATSPNTLRYTRITLTGGANTRQNSFTGNLATPIGSEYIIRITNPTNSEGTINAILSADSVDTLDHNISAPEFPQNSGSYAYDTTEAVPVTSPYVIASNLPTTEQTGTSFTFNVAAFLDGTQINPEGLTASDFIITSPDGNLTPTLS